MCTHGASTNPWIYWPPCPPSQTYNFRQHSWKQNAFLFFEILEMFRLYIGQITSNLLKKAYITWQHAFLSTSIALYNVLAQVCTVFGWERWHLTLGWQSLFGWEKLMSEGFSFFYGFFFTSPYFPFLPFFCSDRPYILSLLLVQKFSEKASWRQAVFTME